MNGIEKIIESSLNYLPSGNDPQIFLITIAYLFSQAFFFIFSLVIIMIPILFSIFHINLNRLLLFYRIKKGPDLKSVRQKIQFRLFKGTSWAKPAFNEFRQTWEEARAQGEDKAIIPIRVSDFLPVDRVLDRARNRRISEALPGIFITIGIFGTFLGLVLGLKDLKIAELENLKQGVEHLITGLGLSFYTSLVGIAESVIFSFLYRPTITFLEKSYLKLDQTLSTIFPYESYEKSFRKYYELQADIKHGLQTLATDVATKITGSVAPAIGKVLEQHLIPVMQDLHNYIKQNMEEAKNRQLDVLTGFQGQVNKLSSLIAKHFESSQQKQTEAMEAVLKQYVDYLNDTFKSQFNDLGRIIEETTAAQATIKDQLVEFTKHLKGQFEIQENLIEKTTKAAEILGESLDSLENISLSLKSSADDIASASTLLESAAKSAKEGQMELRETMEQQVQTLIKAREELENVWLNITENARSMLDYTRQTIKELTEGLGNNMVNALNDFDSKVAEIVERFSNTLFQTSETIEGFPAFLIGIDQKLGLMQESAAEQNAHRSRGRRLGHHQRR